MLLDKMDASDAKDIEGLYVQFTRAFADFSVIPTYELTKNASKKFKVMLSGDGGDELFYGYERFESVSKNLKFTWIPKPLRYFLRVG